MPFVQAGDVKLHYVEHGSGDQPLVFIHGYTSSLRNWDVTLPLLPAKFRSFAFDLRGAGDSDRPGHGYNIQQYAEDVHLATRALGLDTFTLIGHSMGGVTGMQLAISHPERLRNLILVAPAPADGVTNVDPAIRAQMTAMRRNKNVSIALTKAFMVRPFPDAYIETAWEDNNKWEDDAYDQAWESLVSLRIGDRLAEIQTPTLMIAGDRDMLLEANVRDAARIPNCGLQVYYRVGHIIPTDVPDQFADLLVDFVEHGPGAPVTMAQRAAALGEMAATA